MGFTLQLKEFYIKMGISNQMNLSISKLLKILVFFFFFWKDSWKVVLFARIQLKSNPSKTKETYVLHILEFEMAFKS